MTNQNRKHLAWLDLETTGLDPERDRILEIAIVITDDNLNEVASLSRVLFTESIMLENMDPWCIDTHANNGLTALCRDSRISRPQAERDVLDVLSAYTTNAGSPLCGASPQIDRSFLHRYMPTVDAWFHYRNLDVSTVRQIVSLWCPERLKPTTGPRHRALDDIRGSIDELRHYREALGIGACTEVAA